MICSIDFSPYFRKHRFLRRSDDCPSILSQIFPFAHIFRRK
ncbi:hypothetical protein SELSPUOL_00447 [Selenomonas sputigena ATCC 35185]|uniref:Uncharacterized protein n=1 Tax=Selenomonas sputigena (strain ATCC 35185 / DSM 20758 / CCUG 44933 / VPI D19B-28) TaxID=546271 RepID=C9LSM1_SELS3|nr:hypothetical protein SELSPUOL_00447 [Selenomonas sputigena ATCC 35185]